MLRTMKSPSPTSSRLPSVERSVMICSTALEASSIRMPCCITARGSRASTRLMRFCTSTEALSVFGAGDEVGDDLDLAERVAGRFEIQDAGRAVELLFDQPRDAVVEVLRRGARIARADRDRRRRDDRILRDRQLRDSQQTAEADQQRHDPREDGPVDKKCRHVDRSARRARCVGVGDGADCSASARRRRDGAPRRRIDRVAGRRISGSRRRRCGRQA